MILIISVKIAECSVLSHLFGDIKVWNVWHWKCRSRSRHTALAMVPLMANIKVCRCCNCAFFASSNRFPHIDISNFVTLKLLENFTMYTIRNCTIQFQIRDSLSDGYSNVCSISHHLRDIRKSNKIAKVWPWKWISVYTKRKSKLYAIRLEMFHSMLTISYHNFSYLGSNI